MKKSKNGKKHLFLSKIARELLNRDFRVAIFGSARIRMDDKIYLQVFKLAEEIGKLGFDMVTGGGPGIMEAANAGHQVGDLKNISDDIGLPIRLPWENADNKHLEIKKHFHKFSGRLDLFMALSSAVIIMPGGIGTCLELFYTWQLIQVKHIKPIPIILFGKMWEELLKWMKKYPLKTGLVSPEDFYNIHVATNNEQVIKILKKTREEFAKKHLHDNRAYLKGK